MRWLRLHKADILLDILTIAFLLASFKVEGNYILSLEKSWEAEKWVFIFPSIALPLIKFSILLFAALKDKISIEHIEKTIARNFSFKALTDCIASIFIMLYRGFDKTSVLILLFGLFMSVLWLGGPIIIRVILKHKKNQP